MIEVVDLPDHDLEVMVAAVGAVQAGALAAHNGQAPTTCPDFGQPPGLLRDALTFHWFIGYGEGRRGQWPAATPLWELWAEAEFMNLYEPPTPPDHG